MLSSIGTLCHWHKVPDGDYNLMLECTRICEAVAHATIWGCACFYAIFILCADREAYMWIPQCMMMMGRDIPHCYPPKAHLFVYITIVTFTYVSHIRTMWAQLQGCEINRVILSLLPRLLCFPTYSGFVSQYRSSVKQVHLICFRIRVPTRCLINVTCPCELFKKYIGFRWMW